MTKKIEYELKASLIIFVVASGLVFSSPSKADEKAKVKVEEKNSEEVNANSTKPKRALSVEEQEILKKGEISTGRYVAGGIVGSVHGLGIGHAIQGQWRDMGWVFTAVEAPLLAAYIYGSATRKEGVALVSYAGFLGMHVWEIIDVWTRVPRKNRIYRELKEDVGDEEAPKSSWFAAPVLLKNYYGLTMGFKF